MCISVCIATDLGGWIAALSQAHTLFAHVDPTENPKYANLGGLGLDLE